MMLVQIWSDNFTSFAISNFWRVLSHLEPLCAAAAWKGWHNDDVRWCMQLAWQRQKLTLINAITLAASMHCTDCNNIGNGQVSELSTAQLLAQPRSFLKLNFAFFSSVRKYIFPTFEMNCSREFVVEAQSYIWFQSRIFKCILNSWILKYYYK